MKGGIFLGLGSNLGDREENLSKAAEILNLPIVRSSSVYETEPVDFLDQPWFCNCVLEVSADLAPGQLLRQCQSVEETMGRLRQVPKGPRIIDVDILFCGNLVMNSDDLVIPHPAIAQRRFVLEPLAEIAAGFIHPVLRRSISELLAACPDRSQVRKVSRKV